MAGRGPVRQGSLRAALRGVCRADSLAGGRSGTRCDSIARRIGSHRRTRVTRRLAVGSVVAFTAVIGRPGRRAGSDAASSPWSSCRPRSVAAMVAVAVVVALVVRSPPWSSVASGPAPASSSSASSTRSSSSRSPWSSVASGPASASSSEASRVALARRRRPRASCSSPASGVPVGAGDAVGSASSVASSLAASRRGCRCRVRPPETKLPVASTAPATRNRATAAVPIDRIIVLLRRMCGVLRAAVRPSLAGAASPLTRQLRAQKFRPDRRNCGGPRPAVTRRSCSGVVRVAPGTASSARRRSAGSSEPGRSGSSAPSAGPPSRRRPGSAAPGVGQRGPAVARRPLHATGPIPRRRGLPELRRGRRRGRPPRPRGRMCSRATRRTSAAVTASIAAR